MLKIRRIIVENLFDYYCYEIKMNTYKKVSIIHAPNGYGKTTVFNLVKNLLDFDVENILPIPFEKFFLELTDGTKLGIERAIGDYAVKTPERRAITFSILEDNGNLIFTLPLLRPAFTMIREIGIDNYIRRMEMRRRHVPADERDATEINNIVNKYEKFREKLDEISRNLHVNFIESNRLFSTNSSSVSKIIYRKVLDRNKEDQYYSDEYYDDEPDTEEKGENIIRDAKGILFQIQRARQIYSLESEKKDRDFPDRLVKFVNTSNEFFDDDRIAKELDILEKKRLELENAGLVLSGKKTLAPTASIDDTMRKFYTLYIRDTLEKLSLYDDIKSKLELFIEIINTKTAFSNKKMRIDNEKGVIFETINSKSGKQRIIPLEKLSSGEKHDFIMFYELIFNSDNTNVFLIDEPEISLHVAWQMQFIDVLERICELNGTQALVATHSPDIVNGHDDLLISLGLEDENNVMY